MLYWMKQQESIIKISSDQFHSRYPHPKSLPSGKGLTIAQGL